MGIELLLYVLAGCLLGVLTGLLPGLHVNTIALIALGSPSPDPLCMVVLIASMSTVHTFVDFIPSVLFGAPDTDSFLGVLPGHRMLLQGHGLEAVKLTIAGGLAAGMAAMLVSPLFLLFIQRYKEGLPSVVPFVLAAILLAMFLSENGLKRKAAAATVIILSGLLGMLALRGSLPLQQPLFCLATGFFGCSTLIASIMQRPLLKKQEKRRFGVGKGRVGKNSVLALAGGCIVSLLPSIGAAQAAFIMRNLVTRIRTRDYLVMLGGVNTSTMILSFFVLFGWGKTRTGSAAAISQLGSFGLREMLLVAAACTVALGFAAIAADFIAEKAIRVVHRLNYRKINAAVLCFVTGLVLAFSGLLGLAFYCVAASIGIVALKSGIKRTNSMAFLMLPTMAFYAGLLV